MRLCRSVRAELLGGDLHLVKVSLDLVSELGLLAALLPVDVLAEHAGHPLVGGEGAQLEALHQEQVLELDLDTQCTAASCSLLSALLCSHPELQKVSNPGSRHFLQRIFLLQPKRINLSYQEQYSSVQPRE